MLLNEPLSTRNESYIKYVIEPSLDCIVTFGLSGIEYDGSAVVTGDATVLTPILGTELEVGATLILTVSAHLLIPSCSF